MNIHSGVILPAFFNVLTNFLKGVDFIIEKIKFPVLYLLIGYESVLMLLP